MSYWNKRPNRYHFNALRSGLYLDRRERKMFYTVTELRWHAQLEREKADRHPDKDIAIRHRRRAETLEEAAYLLEVSGVL